MARRSITWSTENLPGDIFADDFQEFIRLITTDPVKRFDQLGGFVRYSDGKKKDWVPARYLADTKRAKSGRI